MVYICSKDSEIKMAVAVAEVLVVLLANTCAQFTPLCKGGCVTLWLRDIAVNDQILWVLITI